jgi:hypothetical protein
LFNLQLLMGATGARSRMRNILYLSRKEEEFSIRCN